MSFPNPIGQNWVPVLSQPAYRAQNLSLFDWIQQGKSVKEIKGILDRVPPDWKKEIISQRDMRGFTPLIAAAEIGLTDFVDYLLDEGVCIDEESTENKLTPLHAAAIAGQHETVKRLLERNANREALTSNEEKPLYLAAIYGREETVMELLNAKAEIEGKNNKIGLTGPKGCTPLLGAAFNGRENIVQLLIKEGADIKAMSDEKFSPLYWAAYQGKTEVVEMLLNAGAEINGKNGESEDTALHAAVGSGHVQTVRKLLEKKADPNIANGQGIRPLCTAALMGKDKVLPLLIAYKANMEEKNGVRGYTALLGAIKEGRLECVKWLLDHGADIEGVSTDKKRGPLCTAGYERKPAIVEELLKKGARINAVDEEGCSCLHFSAYNGDDAITALLLQHGADKEIQDYQKFRPLHYAAQEGHLAVVKRLLNAGADFDAINESDYPTPLSSAALNGSNEEKENKRKEYAEAVYLLLQKGADINAFSANVENLFGFDDSEISLFLLQKGADVHAHPGKAYALFELYHPEINDLTMKQIQREIEKACDSSIPKQLEKLGIWQGRRPEFEPGEAGAEAAQLEQVERCRRVSNSAADDAAKNQFFRLFGYKRFEDYIPWATRLHCNLETLKVANGYYSLSMPYEMNERMKALTQFVLFGSPVPHWLEKEHARLTDFESRWNEVDKKDKDAMEKLNSDLEAYKLFNNRLLNAHIQLVNCFLDPIVADLYYPKSEIPVRVAALQTVCQEVLTKIKQETKTFNDLEKDFDEKEIFPLLTALGGGLPVPGITNSIKESYIVLFGGADEDFYRCGLESGRDLRILGVDFSIKHLLSFGWKGNEEKIWGIVRRKEALLKKLKKEDPKIDALLMWLNNPPEFSRSNDWIQFEADAGRVFLRAFFSQGADKIENKLLELERGSLSQIFQDFSTEDFYRFLDLKRKRKAASEGSRHVS